MSNQTFFLDWFNNFLTFNYMARHYSMSLEQVATKVRKGRIIHESQFNSIVFEVMLDVE